MAAVSLTMAPRGVWEAWLFFYAACYITQSLTFFDCLFIYVPEKMPSNTLHSFILSRKHNLDMRCWARHISLCSIYFICQKVAIDFCKFLSQLLRMLSSYLKLWNKKWGSLCSFESKGTFISLSSLVWGKSLTFCMRMRSCVHANGSKIVHSRDVQCNTKESL